MTTVIRDGTAEPQFVEAARTDFAYRRYGRDRSRVADAARRACEGTTRDQGHAALRRVQPTCRTWALPLF